jgi:hypothetical protein
MQKAAGRPAAFLRVFRLFGRRGEKFLPFSRGGLAEPAEKIGIIPVKSINYRKTRQQNKMRTIT